MIAVIALLACLHNAISADGKFARIAARISIDLIAIIALFRALLEAITTSRPLAIVGTRIGITQITIVALLIRIRDAITTDGVRKWRGLALSILKELGDLAVEEDTSPDAHFIHPRKLTRVL